MAKRKVIPNKPKCPTCNGDKGWWEVGNGHGFKGGKRKWRTCPTCKGAGTVD